MNKILLIFTIIWFTLIAGSNIARAQETHEKNFLFRSEKLQLSTFFVELSPQTEFSKLNGQTVNIGVFSAGFILNDKFALSFYMASSPKVNLIPVPIYPSEEYDAWIEAGVELEKLPSSQELVYVDFRHSGLRLDYLHRTDRILFWRGSVSAGFLGGLTLSENQTFMGLFNNVIYKESAFSLEPELGMGVNLLNWWRIYLDVGYRFVAADTRIMSAADTDSFTFSLSFAFGKFGQ